MLKKIVLLIIITGLGVTQPSYAISARALNQKILGNEVITVIDVRNNVLYQKGHIYNAINIPASTIERKRLPELGSVIVYGDGIDEEEVAQAVASLNTKPGIQAQALRGGFSAWSATQNVVQRESGLGFSQVKSVTYKKLQKLAERSHSLVLVDLRIGKKQESLAEHFPNVQIYDPIDIKRADTSNASVSSEILAIIPKHNRQILILIDDGNGLSEKVSDKLHAAGTKRLVILSGGEEALRARGEFTEEVRKSGD